MLSIFRIRGAPVVKMGFTGHCPWRRVANGLWSNIHPPQCCNRLSWHDLELIALFKGGKSDEAAIQRALPPSHGEFWEQAMLPPLLGVMGFLLEPLPLPPKPEVPPELERDAEKLPCCGAASFPCWQCDKTFRRWHHLVQHKQVHREVKPTCSRCGRPVLKQNLKRHQGSKSCRA